MSILVTGGAGFVGCHLVQDLLGDNRKVTVLDSLSRRGSERNLEWLHREHSDGDVRFVKGDVRDPQAVKSAAEDVDAIYHLAGQVAVTSSVQDPRLDFEINALGTLNVLEAARQSPCQPVVMFTSTNKVYGGMEDVALVEKDTRYEYRDLPDGIPESRPLDFHSPYGCSKGAADQYVRDYARIYGLRTVVFRMSCIYGPRQFGNEDQGWLAHFIISAGTGAPITIYGDGEQVRDVLFVEDLVRALRGAVDKISVTAGKVYNIGGGAGENLVPVARVRAAFSRVERGSGHSELPRLAARRSAVLRERHPECWSRSRLEARSGQEGGNPSAVGVGVLQQGGVPDGRHGACRVVASGGRQRVDARVGRTGKSRPACAGSPEHRFL